MARILYSDDALLDFEWIIEFALTAAPGSSAEVIERIRDAIAMLAQHPLSGGSGTACVASW